MKYLGEAKLVESDRTVGGKTVRAQSWDLRPWGGPAVFMGPVEQQLPVGTTDRGTLRLDTFSGSVWRLEAGDPPPTLGVPGVALSLWPFLLVTGLAWMFGSAARRR